MSWEDEDFETPVASSSVAVDDWEFEGNNDEDGALLESWDVDSDEEREKAAKVKQEAELKKKLQKEKLEAKRNPNKTKTLMEIDLVDEKTRKEMLKKAEVEADLNNAADLFDGLGLNEHPRSRAGASSSTGMGTLQLTADTPLSAHPLFSPTTKQDYEKLRKKLAETLLGISEKSTLFYANSLAVDLVRDVCGPLTIEQTRKAISTLNSLVTQKVKDERASRMKKTGGTSTGGAGKKKVKADKVNTGPSNFTKDNIDDYIGGDEDFGDDDFM